MACVACEATPGLFAGEWASCLTSGLVDMASVDCGPTPSSTPPTPTLCREDKETWESSNVKGGSRGAST